MYRRLILFGLSVVAVAVIALVIPLGMAARDIVRTEEMGEIANRARATAGAWESVWRQDDHQDEKPVFPIPPGDGTVSLVLPNGEVQGPPVPAEAQPAVDAAKKGGSASLTTGSAGYSTTPVLLDEETGVVLVAVTDAELREGLLPRLAALAGFAAALLLFAAVAAWILARRTVRPIQDLASTADAIADGDLTARVPKSSIKEVQDVGTAMNRMAVRVQELLDEERANAAELAHQLRTPLTVLTVDVDAVSDPEVRARLQEDALELQRTTDEIIVNARRSQREGLRARCDAAAVVAQRAGFWQVLADDQKRAAKWQIPRDPLWVRLTEEDLTTLIDVLLQNVFIHTPEGTGYEVAVSPTDAGAVAVTVTDSGQGFTDPGSRPVPASNGDAPGSTGLGLLIAARLADAAGGRLECGNRPEGGAAVTAILGPAQS